MVDSLFALYANIRLGLKCLTQPNTQAYFATVKITRVKSFVAQDTVLIWIRDFFDIDGNTKLSVMNIKTHISCLYSQVEITLLSANIY